MIYFFPLYIFTYCVSGLKQLLDAQQLCDVTLLVEGKKFMCHRYLNHRSVKLLEKWMGLTLAHFNLVKLGDIVRSLTLRLSLICEAAKSCCLLPRPHTRFSLKNKEEKLNCSAVTSHVLCICDICDKSVSHVPLLRVLLAAVSPYFRAMFTSPLVESRLTEIRMEEVTPSVMETVIQFVYSGEAGLSLDTAEDLFVAANRLQVVPLQDLCSR